MMVRIHFECVIVCQDLDEISNSTIQKVKKKFKKIERMSGLIGMLQEDVSTSLKVRFYFLYSL